MTKLRFLSAALIAATMLATPALARENHAGSRCLSKTAEASTERAVRHIGEGDRSLGYKSHDAWGHWGTYYGPMVPSVP